MDIEKLIKDLHGLLKQYGEKIPYGELVGAPWPYSRAGDLVWQDLEPYLIEQAANAIANLLARAEAIEARCKTFEKMVREYQDEIVPGYRELAEKAERERDEAIGDLETIMVIGDSGLDTCDFCKNSQCYVRNGNNPCLPKWRGIQEE